MPAKKGKPTKSGTAKKGTAKKAGTKKGTAKKGTAKKATAKKATAKKATATAKAGPKQFQRAYTVNMSSLKALEIRCEADEANLTAKITNLQLGTTDGTKVTAGIYERALGVMLGNLAFEEFKTDVDKGSIKAIHQTKGDTFLFEGAAYITGNPIKVLVFREK